MAVDVIEVEAQTEDAEPSGSLPPAAEAMDLFREGLKDTTPAQPSEPPDAELEETPADPEGGAEGSVESPDDNQPSGKSPSRLDRAVAREVGKVREEYEPKLTAAEQRAQEAEAKLAEIEQSGVREQSAQVTEQLKQEYTDWVGDDAAYAEAQRLSRLDPDSPNWDWEQHKAAVLKLEGWDKARKLAGPLWETAKAQGAAEKHAEISGAFLETLAADLPEDKRDAYKKQPDIAKGVRFYAEQIYAPKIEALESTIAEREAEIERLRTTGVGVREPLAGGVTVGGTRGLDYRSASPEQLFSEGIRENQREQRAAARRR